MLHQRRKKYYYYRDEGTSPLPPQQQRQPTTTLTTTTPTARKKVKTKVTVVYYISRNGHLEQPHFTEVPLSSSDGLHIRDVIAWLNVLRGHGLAEMYSWSSERNYKSRYVWQDLSEDDLIQPCNGGQEYVLKGSELPQLCPSRSIRSHDATPSPGRIARDCSSTYEVIRSSTDMSTQTDHKRIKKGGGGGSLAPRPGTSSSNEVLEGVIVTVGYDHNTNNNHGSGVRNQGLEIERPSGRMKAASSALIHVIMCGPKGVGVVDAIDNVRV